MIRLKSLRNDRVGYILTMSKKEVLHGLSQPSYYLKVLKRLYLAKLPPESFRRPTGTLIILRSIYLNSDSLPDPLVTMRIYITDSLILSTAIGLFMRSMRWLMN
ncbi:zinc transporter [Budvicia aquatica]|uniref:Zinc transporter n=1 Tax=Budvicia aquatica TaxID=82979 RepID=A0A484ZQE1_9GAMM|nr:zinc transporter [Budvicia aquatica]